MSAFAGWPDGAVAATLNVLPKPTTRKAPSLSLTPDPTFESSFSPRDCVSAARGRGEPLATVGAGGSALPAEFGSERLGTSFAELAGAFGARLATARRDLRDLACEPIVVQHCHLRAEAFGRSRLHVVRTAPQHVAFLDVVELLRGGQHSGRNVAPLEIVPKVFEDGEAT